MMRLVGKCPLGFGTHLRGDRGGRARPVGAVALTAAAALAAALASFPGRTAVAQVLEPNGVPVPSVNAYNGEVSLQSYFTTQMESIDAVKSAAIVPGVFEPLCGFQATLVLKESSGSNGIAWYNVPASPTAAPTELFLIIPAGTPVGQVVTSADIRNNPRYAQGPIGFALTDASGTKASYYSEYMRNVYCSGCTTPDYWKMALIYRSTVTPETYYLAFEDYAGADASSWQGNDGDFNDKVFRINGVTCQGGGSPCDTGKLGVCSTGLTECTPGSQPLCKQQVGPTAELCDNLDNDCNGQIDDGPGLCPADQTCFHGACIRSCGNAEFDCLPPFVCESELCIHRDCIGKLCPDGQICRAGTCMGGCEGVVCPVGQDCELGACLDLCAGVACGPDTVCERGVCVSSCRCRSCAAGKRCDATAGASEVARCVEGGCESVTCPAGQVCRGGVCGDACLGAVCPGNAACHAGACDKPDPNQIPVNLTGSGGGPVFLTGSGGTSGAGTGNGSGSSPWGTGASYTSPGTGAATGAAEAPVPRTGCQCTLAEPSSSTSGLPRLLALALTLGVLRKRRKP